MPSGLTSSQVMDMVAIAIENAAGKSLSEADQSKKTKVAEVVRAGTKLMIPEGMSLSDAKRSIEAKE